MEHFQMRLDIMDTCCKVCVECKRPQCRLNTNNLMNNRIYADVLAMLTFPS